MFIVAWWQLLFFLKQILKELYIFHFINKCFIWNYIHCNVFRQRAHVHVVFQWEIEVNVKAGL